VPTQAVFYREEKGREPVREFLWGRIPEQARLLIEEQIDELNDLPDNAPPLAFPQTSQIAGGLPRWRLFKREMDNPDRRGPRPAGQDAP
jgi:hypothetical protein